MQHERYTLLEPLTLSIHHSQCVSRFRKLGVQKKDNWFVMIQYVDEPVALRKTYWASDVSQTSARAALRWRRFSSTMALLEVEKGHIYSRNNLNKLHIVFVVTCIYKSHVS